MTLKVLALIPARSGSRGLRHKNIKRLAGQPLVCRAIELAKSCSIYGEEWTVHMSTDSEGYARLGRKVGADIPFLRPARLATDSSRLVEVVRYTLASYRNLEQCFDAVVLLSAVTPLTKRIDVRRGINLFKKNKTCSVASVVENPYAPSWIFSMRRGRLYSKASESSVVRRRQEASSSWALNGAFYIASADWLDKNPQFVKPGETQALVMPRHRSLDIETASDFKIAQALLGEGSL